MPSAYSGRNGRSIDIGERGLQTSRHLESSVVDPYSGLTSGTVLDGRYRVGALIARGGMSMVYRGVDTRLDRPVAIKVMSPHYVSDPAFLSRFEREARLAASLGHSGVVAVYDQGRDGDLVFLVMELVDGGTLRDLLREQGSLSVPVTMSILEPLLAALGAAHAAGLVHRDVKPENVLISVAGRGEDRRLRPGPGGHLADHGHRRRHPRHRRLPLPGAGRHRRRGRQVRCLRRRRRGLRDAHRAAAFRRRQPDVGGLPARALRRPAARPATRSARRTRSTT